MEVYLTKLKLIGTERTNTSSCEMVVVGGCDEASDGGKGCVWRW